MTIIAHKLCKIIIPRNEYTFSERAKAAVKFKIDDAREFSAHYCVSVCVFRSVVGGTRSKFEMRRRFFSTLPRAYRAASGAAVYFSKTAHLSPSPQRCQKDAALRAAHLSYIYCEFTASRLNKLRCDRDAPLEGDEKTIPLVVCAETRTTLALPLALQQSVSRSAKRRLRCAATAEENLSLGALRA
jgi:hypothetical protein